MTLQSNIINKIQKSIKQKEESLEFFLQRIIVSDNEKQPIQELINKIDENILLDINSVNQKLINKQVAYQNRIDSGCRSDLFWRVISSSTTVTTGSFIIATTKYKLQCTKISPNGYPPIVVTKPSYLDRQNGYIYSSLNLLYGIRTYPIDNGTTLQYVTPSGISTSNTNFPLGTIQENLFGLKYYNEPYTKDIGDTFVASFPGKIGIGKTTLTALTTEFQNVSNIKLGNIIVCNKSGVFPTGFTTIVGIGTTLGNINFNGYSSQGSGIASVSTVGIGTIVSIQISDGGYGYNENNPPLIFIESPGNLVAIATAVVSVAGTITKLTLSDPGIGYSTAPTIQISSPYDENNSGFVTATATSQIGVSGTVTSLTITNPGTGYTITDPPLVYFSAPLNETATAQSVVSIGGTVESIVIVNPGAGYTTSRIPSVFIDPPYQDVLPSFLLKNSASAQVSAPEPDGSLVTFTALLSEDQINTESWGLPFGELPFSPQTIGIMTPDNLGIGTYIQYDNSGNINIQQTWRPELKRDDIRDSNGNILFSEIKEPQVGAGKIYHKEGFNFRPITDPLNPTSYATEGQIIEVTVSYYDTNSLSSYVTPCPSCSSAIDNSLTTAINDAAAAVNAIKSNTSQSTLNCKIEASNAARNERDSINAEIWGQRTLIGQLVSEVKKLKQNLKRYQTNIGISTYNTGDDTNEGIDTNVTNKIFIDNNNCIYCYDN